MKNRILDGYGNMSKDRLGKTLLYVVTDIIIVDISLLVAISLWFDGSIPGGRAMAVPTSVWQWFQFMGVFAPVVAVLVYGMFHMYNSLWKYASIDEILKIFVSSILIYIILFLFDHYVLSGKNLLVLPRRLLFTAWMLNTMFFTFSRFGYRAVRRFLVVMSHIMTSKAGCRRVMVIGAGFSGYGVVRGMLNSKIRDRIPAIIVDDTPGKNNTSIMGVRVLSGIDRIQELVNKFQIDEIIIAVPDAEMQTLAQIMDQCTMTDCQLKIIPPISDVSDGNYQPTVREVSISDLLYRDEIKLDNKNISDYLNNRRVMVTGGGGFIGSELCRQIARFRPEQIIIFDIYENNAYNLMRELEGRYKGELNVVVRIGSIRDIKRVDAVFDEYRPHVVFHAAAHKHVPLMEESPGEAVKNNVFGTYNVVRCANKYKTERFVLVSTDKAVNPTNVYGATKRVAELTLQNMSEKSETKFMTVRFGNVLGSDGSFLPLFKQQIASGGPVTVTHPDMERFFMTAPEACQLILQASGLGKSGRTFVLDMGERVNIDALTRKLIRLSGLRPDTDIEIQYIGFRPGEKLKEELILDAEKENMQVTCHKKIFVTKMTGMDGKKFDAQLKVLHNLAENEPGKVEGYLRKMVPEFTKEESPAVGPSILREETSRPQRSAAVQVQAKADLADAIS